MQKFDQAILIIFDGWGLREDKESNAIENAKKPYFDFLWQNYPHTQFEASGESVGLPPGNIGSSEIAHTIIGAGSILDTDMVKIAKYLETHSLTENPAIKEAFDHVKKHNSTLHLCGQVSPGGVHSHQEHLFAILRAAKDYGLTKVVIHAFTDGRDTSPTSGRIFIKELEDQIEKIGVGFIATLSGRYFAMDRNDNWDRLQKVEDAIFKCIGTHCDISASSILQKLYTEGQTDEFIQPLVFKDEEGNNYPLSKNDSVIFFNFRPDRARMLDQKLEEKTKSDNLCFVTLTEHDPKYQCLVAFPPGGIPTTLGEQISKAGLTQAHIAETEKYAHLTYFFNGEQDKPYPQEKDILIDSRRDIPTHDLTPEMKAKEITDTALDQLEKGTNFIAINYANADMIGHTGNYEATITAIETLDKEFKRLVEKAIEKQIPVFITADHGNAEQMKDPKTGEIYTAHTLFPVPAIITLKNAKLNKGNLADIAPTILQLLGIEKPKEMTGHNLIEEN